MYCDAGQINNKKDPGIMVNETKGLFSYRSTRGAISCQGGAH